MGTTAWVLVMMMVGEHGNTITVSPKVFYKYQNCLIAKMEFEKTSAVGLMEYVQYRGACVPQETNQE